MTDSAVETQSGEPIIELRHVDKWYGEFRALKDINLEVKKGERIETQTYFEDTLGRPPGRADDPLRDGVKMGTTLVGSPETVIKGINRLLEYSQGGFGGILFRAHEWATREQTLRSYELFAEYVMPRYTGHDAGVVESERWAQEMRDGLGAAQMRDVQKAMASHAAEQEARQGAPAGVS